jgi:hypothetical protein
MLIDSVHGCRLDHNLAIMNFAHKGIASPYFMQNLD